MAILLDGKALAAQVRATVADAAARFHARRGRVAGLDVVLVGDDPSSASYVRSKARACEAAGLRGAVHRLPADVTQSALLDHLAKLQADDAVDALLVQLPLPLHIDPETVMRAVDPARDADGLHPDNAGLLFLGKPRVVPCTPAGCIAMLDHAGVRIDGADALVIGRSNLVGKPTAMLLLQRNATVTLAHARTRDLADICRRADIVVAAVGRPELVRGGWIKPGAAVLDVGMNHRDDRSVVGDVEFAAAERHAGWISPVPGGVGPMTVAYLLVNVVRAAWSRAGYPEDQLRLELPGPRPAV